MNRSEQHGTTEIRLQRFGATNVLAGKALLRKQAAAFKVTMMAVVSFLIVWWWLGIVLQFDLMQSDVVGYWQDSLAWRTPFNPDHVPGYPLLIAFLRFLAPKSLNPIILFWAVTFCAHIAGALAVYRCVASRTDERVAYLSVLLFLLWPFVGTTYVVFPYADSLALALIAIGLTLLLSERFCSAAGVLGLAMVIHKASWIFVILLLVPAVITHPRRFPWTAALIAACPIGLLWVAGIAVNGYGPFWLLSVSLPIQFASKSYLPLLDGLFGTMVRGGAKDIAKSVILWAHAVFLIGLALALGRERDRSIKWYGLATLGGVLFLFTTLNQDIIWAAMRYSKIAAVPFGLYLGRESRLATALMRPRWMMAGLVTGLMATQFLFCWYIAEIVFS